MQSFKQVQSQSSNNSTIKPAHLPSNRDDWDVKSCYSVNSEFPDEEFSYQPSLAALNREDDVKSNVSNVDTLSFHSDPILTPHELILMGDGKIPLSIPKQTGPRNIFQKRRGF